MYLGSCIAVAVVYRLAAVAPIWPPAWEAPYATSAALKSKKKKNLVKFMKMLVLNNNKEQKISHSWVSCDARENVQFLF